MHNAIHHSVADLRGEGPRGQEVAPSLVLGHKSTR